MALEIEKKKNTQDAEAAVKAKGKFVFVVACCGVLQWLRSVIFIWLSNFQLPIRVVGVIILLIVALAIAAITNPRDESENLFN